MEVSGATHGEPKAARTAIAIAGAFARTVARAIVPASCVACRQPLARDAALCEGCELRMSTVRAMKGGPPPGIDWVWSAAHHDGVARELVSALKHGRVLGAARRMGAEIAARAPAELIADPLVPAPSAPARRRARGFEPAAEIVRALVDGSATGMKTAACIERSGGPRQVGQSRGMRRAARFEVWCTNRPPPRCVLVDDVLTTGGTLTACAIALREAGAESVGAVTFTRRM